MSIARFHFVLACSALAALFAACAGPQSPLQVPAQSAASIRAHTGGSSGTEQVLYSFSGGNDGGNAATGLVFDHQGNLYGTTVIGGAYTCGTVFELSPRASLPWLETVLFNFGCYDDGKSPHGGVTFDRHGNLEGTTVAGGTGGFCTSDGCGIIYRLSSTTEKVLYNFTGGTDGFGPGGTVVFDRAGNSYGSTPDGGAYYEGVVYKLSRSGKYHVIHAFTGGKDGGVGSLGSLLLDKGGNIYGVTELGGANGSGTVFELSPISKNHYKLTTLYAFKTGTDAAFPYGGLVADKSGNLFGTTYYGGAHGVGAVYELVRKGKGKYRERVLYSFQGGSDGSYSTSTLIFGASGDLYGTTSSGGGTCDCGTIFKIDPSTGSEHVLHAFGTGTDGAYPYYGLTADKSGNFYGTTVAGGSFGQGVVFEFTP
jgi:uncharacterized repeat protein (TIGR03803 family)